jgi:hypothetical protein
VADIFQSTALTVKPTWRNTNSARTNSARKTFVGYIVLAKTTIAW